MAKYVSLIRRHETEMKALHTALGEAFKVREQSSSRREDWLRLASQFRGYRSAVDDWMELIKEADSIDWANGRETVFDDLEVDPFYFRSGYTKEMLVKFVKRLELTETERMTIRKLIIRRIEEGGKREFRRLCQLIPKIQTPEFKTQLRELSLHENQRIVLRAEIATSYLI